VFRNICSLIAALALSTSSLAAQTAMLGGTIAGDSLGHPVGGAEVSIPSLGLKTTTNYMGEFRFSHLPAGLLTINIRHLGFAPLSDTVTVSADAPTNRDFQLSAQATTLDSVKVTEAKPANISPGLAEFEERR
jgi:hypothetical protein